MKPSERFAVRELLNLAEGYFKGATLQGVYLRGAVTTRVYVPRLRPQSRCEAQRNRSTWRETDRDVSPAV